MKQPGRQAITEQLDSASPEVSSALRTLLRGLTQNNIKDVFAGHRALFKLGVPVIPHIKSLISQSNWSKIKHANEIRYLTGLISILHDIDESESAQVARELKRNGCDPSIAHILNSICRFTISDYTQYDLLGIHILEHKRLPIKQAVRPRLERWLRNIPQEDLQEIERIYILRRGDLHALGTYTPILYSINLVWDNPSSRWNPLSWINLFIIESTLYHEIGHHIHRHTFGQDEEQEKQANKYSDYIMANSNHLFFKTLRALFGAPRPRYRKRGAND